MLRELFACTAAGKCDESGKPAHAGAHLDHGLKSLHVARSRGLPPCCVLPLHGSAGPPPAFAESYGLGPSGAVTGPFPGWSVAPVALRVYRACYLPSLPRTTPGSCLRAGNFQKSCCCCNDWCKWPRAASYEDRGGTRRRARPDGPRRRRLRLPVGADMGDAAKPSWSLMDAGNTRVRPSRRRVGSC